MYNRLHDYSYTALNNNIYQQAVINVTLKNNETLTITNADIVENSLSIDRYTVTSGSVALGTGVAAELNVKLNNHDGRFDGVNFAGAWMTVGIKIDDGTHIAETVPMGIFIVNNNPRHLSTISITALDKMILLDKPVDRSQHTLFPRAMPVFLIDCISQVGGIGWNTITIQTLGSKFANTSIYINQLPPTDGILTYRQLLMWCAGILGACLYVNFDGQLDLGWYNVGDDVSPYYESYPSTRYNSDVYEEEISFTGLFYKGEDKAEYLVGDGDYVIDLSNNALVTCCSHILNSTDPQVDLTLGNIDTEMGISSLRYTIFSADVKPAPYLWPMDGVYFEPLEDSQGFVTPYYTTLTHVHYVLNGATTIGASGETLEEHQVAPQSSGGASIPNISANNIDAAGNANITGNLTVGGTASFAGNMAVGADKLLKVVNVTVMSGQSIASGSYSDGTVSANALQTAIGTGWTPLGLVGVHAGGTNNVGCAATQYYINSSGGITVRARNFSASASTLTMSVDVLCIRTSL